MKPARFLGVELADGVRARNMAAYLAVALITSGYFGGMAMLQPGLFALMGIDQAEQGALAGQLGAIQELTFILLAGVFGVLSERFGRRLIYVGGLTVAAVGYVLFPRAESVGELFLFRFVFGIGGAALVAMLVTVISDYASDRHRGKANGVQGFAVVLGAFIPFAMAMMPKLFVDGGQSQLEAQRSTFLLMGGIGVVGAFIAAIGLRGAQRRTGGKSQSLWQIARGGLRAARDPGVALSYGAAFISRGDLAVTGAFMMLWATQAAQNDLGLDIAGAQQVAGGLVLMTILGALVGSIAMGFLADRVSRVTAVTLSSGLAAAVYLSMYFVNSPLQGPIKGLLFVMGVAELSAFVCSQALVGQQAPAEQRGVIVGFFGAAGALGMLVGTFVGGKLFQSVGPSAPFVLFGGFNLIVFAWSLVVRRRVVPVADLQGPVTAVEAPALLQGKAA